MKNSAIGYGDENKCCRNCGAARLMYLYESGAHDIYECATCGRKHLHRDWKDESSNYCFDLKLSDPQQDSRILL